MKKKYLSLGLLPAGLLVMTNANAAIISVSFDNSTTVGSPNFSTSDLAGAPGVRVSNWNPWYKDDTIMGDSGQTVVDDAGSTVSGFTTTLAGNNAWAQRVVGSGSNDPRMFGNVLDAFGGNETVSVSGVPYALYDVYVYMYDDRDGRAGSFTIGSTTYYARGIGPQSGSEGVGNPAADGTGYVLSSDTTLGISTDIDQGNYVKFSGLSGAAFDLDLGAVNAGNLDRNKVAGFQIVETIPEPGSALLTLLGLSLGVLGRRR